MANKPDIDSPAGYNGQSGPSKSDLGMPTKHYPQTTNIGNQHSGPGTLEGPGTNQIFKRK